MADAEDWREKKRNKPSYGGGGGNPHKGKLQPYKKEFQEFNILLPVIKTLFIRLRIYLVLS